MIGSLLIRKSLLCLAAGSVAVALFLSGFAAGYYGGYQEGRRDTYKHGPTMMLVPLPQDFDTKSAAKVDHHQRSP